MVQNVEINPSGFYDAEAIGRILQVRQTRISRAVRQGELRSSDRAGRRFFRGAWVIAWLEGEREKSKAKQAEATVL